MDRGNSGSCRRCLQEATTRLAEAERKAAAARADVVRVNREAADAARAAARQLSDARNRAESLAEENTALLLDLNARPALKDHAALHRQLDILQVCF